MEGEPNMQSPSDSWSESEEDDEDEEGNKKPVDENLKDFKPIRRLRKNPDVTPELLEYAKQRMKKEYPENSFYPYVKKRALIWATCYKVEPDHVKQVIAMQFQLSRNFVLNLGAPPDIEGEDLDRIRKEHIQYLKADYIVGTAKGCDAAYHYACPKAPAKVIKVLDTIFGWSFGGFHEETNDVLATVDQTRHRLYQTGKV